MSYINGKIIITKKSGPGELTGITEIELSDLENRGVNNAIFNDLQFSDPGEYVISIYSDSDEIEPLDVKINVLEEELVDQKSKGDNEKKEIDENRSIIAQIDKPTIVVDPIEMNQDETVGSSGQKDFTNGMGYTPLIWYKGVAIEDRSLKYFKLYHNGVLPMVEFRFEDTKDLFSGKFTPTDDSTIDVFLNSTSANLKSIHVVFKIIEFNRLKASYFSILGTINVPDLYIRNSKTYSGTSFDVLREISTSIGLGYNSNISNTNDNMSWRNSYNRTSDFMMDIINRSYIDDESFTGGYIDYYYCFNYVDIEKEMNRDASKDSAIESSGLSEQSGNDESERLSPLVLTNDDGSRTSCFFISKYETINESTKKSLKEGYRVVTKCYDIKTKKFLVFEVDSTTSDGSKSIILKGDKYNNSFVNENVKNVYKGKLMSDNTHEDYHYAETLNTFNRANMNKVALRITLPNANWNLYKFQKVKVVITNKIGTAAKPDAVDWRYSGYYVIADIEYIWDGNKMSQDIRLIRKELGKDPEEIKNDPPQQKVEEKKEVNDNPMSEEMPNEKYEIGQVIVVKNNNDIYELVVTEILENGNDIKGILNKVKEK
jgi:hypothetical protein